MKTYNSGISERGKCYIWAVSVYCSAAIILSIILYCISGNRNDTITPFISAITFMGVYACIKIAKTEYSIADEYLTVRDFKYKKINIFNIKSVSVMEKRRWLSFSIPYNVIIEEVNGEKTYIAPENVDDMLNILKETNEKIILKTKR